MKTIFLRNINIYKNSKVTKCFYIFLFINCIILSFYKNPDIFSLSNGFLNKSINFISLELYFINIAFLIYSSVEITKKDFDSNYGNVFLRLKLKNYICSTIMTFIVFNLFNMLLLSLTILFTNYIFKVNTVIDIVLFLNIFLYKVLVQVIVLLINFYKKYYTILITFLIIVPLLLFNCFLLLQ
ncbi:MAG: hypothetical protein RSB77_01820 [Bacilli bacterium]